MKPRRAPKRKRDRRRDDFSSEFSRMVRQDERRERRIVRGELTFAEHVREIRRDVARAVRP